MYWLWWLGAALVLAIAELAVVDFTFLMLAGAAVIAAAVAGVGASLTVQVVTFAIAAVLLLFVVRPWARRHVEESTPGAKTNVFLYQNESAVTLTEVSTTSGRIKLMGEVWSARTENSAVVIPAGTTVWVARVEGAYAIITAEQPVGAGPSA